MKKLITALLIGTLLTSCSHEAYTDDPAPQQITHDKVPESFIGVWESVTKTGNPIAFVHAETLTFDLTDYGKGIININVREIETKNIGNRLYNIKYNGSSIYLSTGLGEFENQVTLTIDNECITRMKIYVPIAEEPEEEVEPVILM